MKRNSTETRTSIPVITDGPFKVNLRRPLIPGLTTEGQARYILGGPTGSAGELARALEQIEAIDQSLPFSDFRREAGVIFRAHGLQRVDH